jgi:hypothetical protein
MVLLGSGVPVIAESFEKNNFKISPSELESKITKKTKWLILNSHTTKAFLQDSPRYIRLQQARLLKWVRL